MDLRRVRAFIAVAESLSVTKAAERLHISQPPLSRHIHQLEGELGVTLFVRHRHGVTLTDAGRQLLEKARTLDRAAQEFCSTAAQVSRGEANEIRVGFAWGLWDVVHRVRVELARRYPGVTVAPTDAYCWHKSDEQLRSRTLDVVLARPPFDEGFDSRLIFEEPIQVILSDDNPLAARTSLSIADLGSEPLLLWDRQVAPVLYDQIFELYARAGLQPHVVPTPGVGPFNHAGMMLVASGKGIYLGYGVPLTSTNQASGVAVRPLRDQGARVEIRVVTRRGDNSLVVRRFLECVEQVFPREKADQLALASR